MLYRKKSLIMPMLLFQKRAGKKADHQFIG
jgi:hypothetical protein